MKTYILEVVSSCTEIMYTLLFSHIKNVCIKMELFAIFFSNLLLYDPDLKHLHYQARIKTSENLSF